MAKGKGITLGVKVLETDRKLEKAISKAIVAEINSRVLPGIARINNEVSRIIKKAIIDAPAYRSLVAGQLRREFGIPDGDYKMKTLITEWSNSIETIFKPFKFVGRNISGGITLNAVKADFSDVLALPEAVQTTERGSILPWLQWMIDTESVGGTILGYQLGVGQGRAGPVIMIKSRTKSWTVPQEFTGSLSDNFVTQALDRAEPEMQKVIIQELKKVL